MSLSFFVVGDIGEAGSARRAVAQAMAQMLRSGQVDATFVLATGDNFYECKSEEQFQNSFSELQTQMLQIVPLPWYFVLGNHDIKAEGARLHVEAWHARQMGTREAEAQYVSGPRWEFRCPSSYYSVAEDWTKVSSSSHVWDHSLLNMFVLNTNKKKGPLNFFGLWPGSLKATTSSWDEQKCWLRDQLNSSSAAWNFVVGHHPIEFIPLSYKEHGLPGVKFLTAGFMKGHQTSRIRRKGLRDVVVQGGADVYLCGHQHLMAHLVRRGEERSSWRGGGPGPGTLEYWIVGSSSKLEQDIDDLVDVDDGGGVSPNVPTYEETHAAVAAPVQASSARLDLGISDKQSYSEEPHANPISAVFTCCCTNQEVSAAQSSGPQEQEQVDSDGDTVVESYSAPESLNAEAGANRSDNSWVGRSITRLSEKMSTMWYAEQIGFAVVRVMHAEISVCFYGVRGSVDHPEVQLLHESSKRK